MRLISYEWLHYVSRANLFKYQRACVTPLCSQRRPFAMAYPLRGTCAAPIPPDLRPEGLYHSGAPTPTRWLTYDSVLAPH